MTTVNALAVTGLFFCLAVVPSKAADPAFERVVEAARASAVISKRIIEKASAACTTAFCFAKTLAAERPDNVRLEPVNHPDTDTIRWVKTTSSVITDGTDDILMLKITHFGRKAVAELRETLTGVEEDQLVKLDIRANSGGDFERMLEIAGLLIGSRRNVIEIDHGDRVERRSLEGPSLRSWHVTHVHVDEQTASAALLLARLLGATGGAEVIGPDRGGSVFLKRRITVDHDWRLTLPIAEVRIIKDRRS